MGSYVKLHFYFKMCGCGGVAQSEAEINDAKLRFMTTPYMPLFDKETGACKSPHVVILGAGASRDTLPNGDVFGRRLPLMNDLVETVGLEEILSSHGINHEGSNFESLYDELAASKKRKPLLDEVENRIRGYFMQLQLPPYATVYDYLILSLREKDLIATFNWDPLIVQAMARNRRFGPLPVIIFMHGNVGIGICEKDRRLGPIDQICEICKSPFNPSTLLFPIKKKNYQADSYIEYAWNTLNQYLSKAYFVTIFGYSAPDTDVEAKELLIHNWKNNKSFELAEVEIIDIKEREALERTWDDFLYDTHYSIKDNIFSSYLFRHPRRSCDAFAMATLFLDPWEDNPFPKFKHILELQEWIKPLLEEERQGKLSGKPNS